MDIEEAIRKMAEHITKPGKPPDLFIDQDGQMWVVPPKPQPKPKRKHKKRAMTNRHKRRHARKVA